ncbi:hypothetical protein Naga_100001g21 [Nannochloropsis gaditana]|uniref:Uncharacterized protein n=1 Tax=Nannochloropsis gaditana TaxID=72520 RepID=W7TST9_9STRA|nr:hypothetical protein Naga_100001g21 [Nannochloropsis gaditana]
MISCEADNTTCSHCCIEFTVHVFATFATEETDGFPQTAHKGRGINSLSHTGNNCCLTCVVQTEALGSIFPTPTLTYPLFNTCVHASYQKELLLDS